MFRDFGRKVQRDVKRVVDARLKASEDLSAGRIKVLLKFLFAEFFKDRQEAHSTKLTDTCAQSQLQTHTHTHSIS